MTISWLRDLIIVIFGVLGIAALVLGTILACAVYRRMRRIFDSVEEAAANLKEVTVFIKEEVAKPLARLAMMVQGIQQGMNVVNQWFEKHRKKEADNE